MFTTTKLHTTLALLGGFTLACGGGGNGGTTGAGEGSATVAPRTTPTAEPAGREGSAALTEPAVEAEAEAAIQAPAEFDTGVWGELLGRYVTADGGFRYTALVANADDRARLGELVAAVGSANPSAYPERAAQLAFYINAYNILCVAAVVERFPIDSVMSVPGFFDAVQHRVAGASMTLNALETDLIRAQFREPRIHFAVNCASAGCPWLDRTPFTVANLEAALDRLTRQFVGQSTWLDNRRPRVVVSQIFEWYAADFEAGGGVRAFLVAHLEHEGTRNRVAAAGTRIDFARYDWALNGRP